VKVANHSETASKKLEEAGGQILKEKDATLSG
jgi:ribosomal protein L18E